MRAYDLIWNSNSKSNLVGKYFTFPWRAGIIIWTLELLNHITCGLGSPSCKHLIQWLLHLVMWTNSLVYMSVNFICAVFLKNPGSCMWCSRLFLDVSQLTFPTCFYLQTTFVLLALQPKLNIVNFFFLSCPKCRC